ncbi:NCS1 family nucleobase:cation symporter-1 [Streptomyces sioyaensis]|uniref:NCS1 family nucleobase:cation symporter-1 n=1 Tax=Streptomyces sioyaensis TaxID=67364 RepID=UPI0036A528BF
MKSGRELDQPDHAALAAADPTGRLYNEDLAPAPLDRRSWNAYSLLALWMSDAHNIGNYTFAAGLFAIGMAPYQIAIGILGGALIIFLGCTLSGFIGQKTGGPYPVVQRLSWGVFGANIPALIRAIVAIAWYGIQTYLASVAVSVLLLRLAPGLTAMTHHGFLGLDSLSWACFLFLWLLQLVVLTKGMEVVRRFQDWAGPAIWAIMIVLAVWLIIQAHGHVAFFTGVQHLSVGEQVYRTFAAVGLTVSVLATLMLNFSDFARFAPSRKAIVVGNFWGLPINWTAFAVTSAVVSAATVAVYGKAILEPAQLLGMVSSTPLLIVGVIMFIIATIGVNIVANFVSPSYDLANVWPKRITFRRGGVITAVVSVAALPWKLYSSPAVIDGFLGTLGAFLGPLFGIMMTDFYLVKRQVVSVSDLYSPDPGGAYHYRRGVNLRALAAFLPSALVAAVIALVPAFGRIAPFSWFVGVAAAAVLYYALSRHHDSRRRRATSARRGR